MEIVTARLTLRALTTAYLETTHAYASDAALCRYMMRLPNDTEEETRRFLEGCEAEWAKAEPSFYEFAVVLNGAHIGACSLYLNEARDTGELGWILRREAHGRGYATEAAAAVVAFGRGLGLRRIIAHCDAENAASQGVMRRLGLTLVDDNGFRFSRTFATERRECLYALSL